MIPTAPWYGDIRKNEMRRWRVKYAAAYEITCGYEMQNASFALRYDKGRDCHTVFVSVIASA